MAAFRLLLASVCAAVPLSVIAHGGGLDAYGCHHNRKAGGYHCHRGPFAGQGFASKSDMLKELAKRGGDSQKNPRK